MRDDLKPLEIIQPEGPSFTVDGNLIRWQKWSFRVGFTAREGLVLHTVGYDGRPILHRASFCEMAVPYGDPSPNRYIQGPFDIGENHIGTLANALELGCDCLGEIRYLDAWVVNSKGEPVRMPNAICMHEEDFGLLWKHWDFRNGDTEVRRSRRFVISFISTVGNYDYGFYWYLYQDGTIEAEVKATGIMSTAAVPPGETPRHGTLVDEGLNAMIHQHFFNARLDLDVDGARELGLRGRDGRDAAGAEPVRERVRDRADAGAPRVGGAPRRRPAAVAHLVRREREQAERLGPADGLPADPGRDRAAVRAAGLAADEARRLHAAPGLGHGLPPARAVRGRRLPEPARRRRRPARSTRRRTARSRTRTSSCGSRSATTTSRGPRTGRSCPSRGSASCSSRTASSTATRRSTCRRRMRRTAHTISRLGTTQAGEAAEMLAS